MTVQLFDGAFSDSDVPTAIEVLQRNLGESVVVMHPVSGRVLECTSTAAEIFKRCDGAHQVGEIIATLCAEFAATDGEIAGDVRSSITMFAQAGLVHFERGGSFGSLGDGKSRSTIAT